MHPRNRSYGKLVTGPRGYSIEARQQGKTLILQWALRFKIMEVIKDGVPSKPFVIQFGFKEIVTWLPTGEVISRRL